jgi:hypothetical protein
VRSVARRSLEQNHEVVIALARDLASTPGAHEDHGRSRIDIHRAESLATFVEAILGALPSGRYLA